MKPMVLLFVMLVTAAGLGAEVRWGAGAEAEGRWLDGAYESTGLRLSGSGEFRLGGPVWLGFRASVGLLGPGGLWYVVPRANLSVGWEFGPDLTLEAEAPYSPGLGVLLFGRWYLWAGTDELAVDREAVHRCAAVEYRF